MVKGIKLRRYAYRIIKRCGKKQPVLWTNWTDKPWHELERKNKTRVIIIKTETKED